MKGPNKSLFVFAALTVLPLSFGIGYALLYSFGLLGIGSGGFTLQHWEHVLGKGEFWYSLGFSVWIAVCSIGLSLVLALFAVVSGPKKWQRGLLSWAVYLPLALPAMVAAFFIFQMLSAAGLLSRISYGIGFTGNLDEFPNLTNDPAGVGIIVSHVLMATPFFIILFSNLYQSERLADYTGLAVTLGANSRQVARQVVVPALLKRSFPTLMLYFMFVLGSYEIPLLLGSQSPQMVSVLTVRKLQRFDLADMPQAHVISILYTAFVLMAVIVLLRGHFKKTATI